MRSTSCAARSRAPDLDLRVDLAPAFLIFRTLIDDRPDDPDDPDDLARRLCALVLGSVTPSFM
jgi:hypothetical protein